MPMKMRRRISDCVFFGVSKTSAQRLIRRELSKGNSDSKRESLHFDRLCRDGRSGARWQSRRKKRKSERRRPERMLFEAGDADESGVVVLFRDPSGAFRNKQYWYEGKIFWSNVMMAVEAKIAGASVGAKPVAASWGQAQPQSGPGLAKPGGD